MERRAETLVSTAFAASCSASLILEELRRASLALVSALERLFWAVVDCSRARVRPSEASPPLIWVATASSMPEMTLSVRVSDVTASSRFCLAWLASWLDTK